MKKTHWHFLNDAYLFQPATLKSCLSEITNGFYIAGAPKLTGVQAFVAGLAAWDLGFRFGPPDTDLHREYFLKTYQKDPESLMILFLEATAEPLDTWPSTKPTKVLFVHPNSYTDKNGVYHQSMGMYEPVWPKHTQWDSKLIELKKEFDQRFPSSKYRRFLDLYIDAVSQRSLAVCRHYYEEILHTHWKEFPYFFRMEAQFRLWWLAFQLGDIKAANSFIPDFKLRRRQLQFVEDRYEQIVNKYGNNITAGESSPGLFGYDLDPKYNPIWGGKFIPR